MHGLQLPGLGVDVVQRVEQPRPHPAQVQPPGSVAREVGVPDDGKFGPRTDAAVSRWQERHGLKPDGLVGVKTWTKMFGGA